MMFEFEEQKNQDTSAEEQKHQNFLDDLREVAKTKAGKRVLGKFLNVAGIHLSSFDQNIQEMCRNEGRREFGLWIEQSLEQIDSNLIYEITKEMNNV